MKRIKIASDDIVVLIPMPWILNTPCSWVKGCPEDTECSECGAHDAGYMTSHYAYSWWNSYELLNGKSTVSYVMS